MKHHLPSFEVHTIDVVEDIIRCTIILHNMGMEAHEIINLEIDDNEETNEVIAGRWVSPVWCGLVCLPDSSDLQDGGGSLVTLCEARAYM